MRPLSIPLCLSSALTLALLACQSPEQVDDVIAPTKTATASQNGPYLFTGSPGIRNSILDDIDGTMVGSVDGQPVNFGPDQAFPLQVRTGLDNVGTKATALFLDARNTQYQFIMFIRGPFEAGRNYRVYDVASDNGDSKDDPYTFIPYVRIPRGPGQIGQDVLNLADPNNQMRITAITPEYIDIEFFFTIKKQGAIQERLNLRIKNQINENLNLRTQSAGEPFWDYTNMSRKIEAGGYWAHPASTPTNYLAPPTVTQVLINQFAIKTPVSEFTYEGKTKSVDSQSISLYRPRSAQSPTQIEYAAGTTYSDTGSNAITIVWPNFTGVGTYTGDQVKLTFAKNFNNQPNGDYWSIRPYLLASSTTKWQVNVQRVTPDLIEGTYTIVDAPLYEKRGTNLPASASVSGRFKVIYPR
ncbi:hypothetical protein [Spirosoma pomorum]|jgi:hypothetical protein